MSDEPPEGSWSSQELLDFVADEFPDLDGRDLETFRVKGLLQTVTRYGNDAQGRPRWRHPAGTERQLLSLLRWRSSTKDVPTLKVLLWISGSPIEVAEVRAATLGYFQSVQAELDGQLSQGDEDQQIQELAAKVARRKGPHTVLPRRRGISESDRISAFEHLIRRVLNRPSRQAQADVDVSRVLGLGDHRRSNVLNGWLTQLPASLSGGSRALNLATLREAVEEADSVTWDKAQPVVYQVFCQLPATFALASAFVGLPLGRLESSYNSFIEQPGAAFFTVASVLCGLMDGDAEHLNELANVIGRTPTIVAGFEPIEQASTSQLRHKPGSKEQRQLDRLLNAKADGEFDPLPKRRDAGDPPNR